MKNKFYVATAIAYTSRKPHIGNTYEIVLADAIARYHRLIGDDVFFLTGTDEHGQKIEELAVAAGKSPKEYVDGVAGEVRSIWDLMNASYDKFIRTTDDYHVKTVQKMFKKFYDQGDIYKGEYVGHYCVPCESFFTDSQLVDGKCPDCGREVKDAKEEAYFFRMSKYQDRLMKYIEEHPDFIVPESRKKEMINNFLKPGLQDLCVSRTSFKWGIPVEFDPKHVVYVWIDALSNYITALGYGQDDDSNYKKYWPCNVHVIGKDILRFHTIYWPIMLMALGEPLPKQIFGHPWLLFGSDKMSKSKGNVMYADELAGYFGVDGVRYYLLSEMPYAADGTITYENIIGKYNSDLANTLGNLVNRTVAMTNKYFGGKVKKPAEFTDLDRDLIETAAKSRKDFAAAMDTYRVADASDAVIDLARRCNKYIDETTPWVLAKDEATLPRLEAVLYNLLEAIRHLAVMLLALLPASAEEIFRQTGMADEADRAWESTETFGRNDEITVTEAKPLFARIDEKKLLAEVAELTAKRAAEAKKEAQKAEKAEKKLPEGIAEISIEDFAKVELRVAKILSCEKAPKSDKLLILKLDDGAEGRQVVSGIAPWYTPEELVGKQIVLVANLKPAKLRGIESEGMILAADAGEKDVKVLFVDESVPAGSRIR